MDTQRLAVAERRDRAVEVPELEAELRRRLADKRPGAWLTVEEFRRRVGLR